MKRLFESNLTAAQASTGTLSIMNSRVPKTATGYPLPNPSLVTQKRLLDPVASDGDDSKSPLKRPRLTRKNLALLDKMGKKTSAPPGSTDDSSSTAETTSTTTSAFAMQAFCNGMLLPRDSRPPTNLQAIRERHARSRASASLGIKVQTLRQTSRESLQQGDHGR